MIGIRVLGAALASIVFCTAASAMGVDATRAWRDDLKFMAGELERLHKNLYHSVARKEFEALVAALDAKIPSLERHEVIVEMARIVAAVGDGHTNIYPTRDQKIGFHTLPVAFTFFGDDLYVRAAHLSHRSLAGAKVLRIGDRGVDDVYASVTKLIGADNVHGPRYWAPYLLAMPEVLHALRITRSVDEVPLTLETSHGPDLVVMHPFGPVEPMSGDIATIFNRRDGWVDVRDLSGRPEPAWLRGSGDAFHFEHFGDLLYVQVNQVGDKSEETLAHFAGRLRDEIATGQPQKVTFDLRLNRGGNATLLVPIIRAIIQSSSIDCKGRLFAIIGPATFSAAQMFVAALEEYTNVTFVGEPSGSKGNAYGDSRKITLPNSGITVRASIYYWQGWHPLDNRSATIPQIPAALTFEAYRTNTDPALEAIQRAKLVSCN